MASAGQSVWQILPLGPPGFGESPYGTSSVFAGNPLLVSAEDLATEGLLPAAALEVLSHSGEPAGAVSPERIEFEAVRDQKEWMLRESWRYFESLAAHPARDEFERFTAGERAGVWLDDWALFAALKARFENRSWMDWPEELRRRESAALDVVRLDLADEVRFQKWVQFLFHGQWSRLRAYAAERAIRVFGDVPIYVIADSADVWSHQELFAFDRAGRPSEVSGVPPDAFAEDGQLWGQPLYRWDRMQEDGYAWWLARMRAAFEQADLVRLDHFRAFAGYWSIPASARSAREGRWVRGPGPAFFEALVNGLGDVEIVAEDLGVITPDVIELRDRFDLAGMRVLQFGFGEIDSPHLPHRYNQHSVVYTGTHDNDTTRGWYESLDSEVRHRVREYLSCDGSNIAWDLIRTALQSVARLAIVPIQDVLDLGSEARFNRPGAGAGNWAWRLAELPGRDEANRLGRLTELSGRLPRSRLSQEGKAEVPDDYFSLREAPAGPAATDGEPVPGADPDDADGGT